MPETQKIRQFNAILTRLRLQEMKPELVLEASQGRTSSTLALEDNELEELINHLNTVHHIAPKEENTTQQYVRIHADKMRKKILHYRHLMLWYLPGTRSLDFAAIDQFCIDRGWQHKPLNQYRYDELPTLVSQFEQVYKHFLSKL